MKKAVLTKKEAYMILGLTEEAGMAEVDEAKKRCAKFFHPDNNIGKAPSVIEKAKEQYSRVMEAYDAIKNNDFIDDSAFASETDAYSPNEAERRHERPEAFRDNSHTFGHAKPFGTRQGTIFHLINMGFAMLEIIVLFFALIEFLDGDVFYPNQPIKPIVWITMIIMIIWAITNFVLEGKGPSPNKPEGFLEVVLGLLNTIIEFLCRVAIKSAPILLPIICALLIYVGFSHGFFVTLVFLESIIIFCLCLSTIYFETLMMPRGGKTYSAFK